MAIKTNGAGAIITRVTGDARRVSCTCCTSVCCMYPADQLGIGYTEDDLPDTINFSGQIMGVPTYVVATRSGSEYVTATQSNALGQTFTQTIFVDFEYGEWITSGNATGDPCLFLGDISEEFAIEDFFADTYTVEFLTNKEVTVTRQSLCSWFGTATIDGFEYEASLGYNDQTFQWEAGFSTVDISSGFNPKDGNQNTPVGTYSGDNVITVSE